MLGECDGGRSGGAGDVTDGAWGVQRQAGIRRDCRAQGRMGRQYAMVAVPALPGWWDQGGETIQKLQTKRTRRSPLVGDIDAGSITVLSASAAASGCTLAVLHRRDISAATARVRNFRVVPVC